MIRIAPGGALVRGSLRALGAQAVWPVRRTDWWAACWDCPRRRASAGGLRRDPFRNAVCGQRQRQLSLMRFIFSFRIGGLQRDSGFAHCHQIVALRVADNTSNALRREERGAIRERCRGSVSLLDEQNTGTLLCNTATAAAAAELREHVITGCRW